MCRSDLRAAVATARCWSGCGCGVALLCADVSDGSKSHGSSNVQCLSGFYAACLEMVPAAHLIHRYIEAVRNGDESVALAHDVALHSGRADRGGYGDDEFVSGRNGLGERDAVRGCDLRRLGVQRGCDLVERLARLDHMEAPTGPFVLGNILD